MGTKTQDYYQILTVDPTASADEIRRAYRKLAKQLHPDAGGKPADFLKVDHAYQTLSKSRASYDATRRNTNTRARTSPPKPTPTPKTAPSNSSRTTKNPHQTPHGRHTATNTTPWRHLTWRSLLWLVVLLPWLATSLYIYLWLKPIDFNQISGFFWHGQAFAQNLQSWGGRPLVAIAAATVLAITMTAATYKFRKNPKTQRILRTLNYLTTSLILSPLLLVIGILALSLAIWALIALLVAASVAYTALIAFGSNDS